MTKRIITHFVLILFISNANYAQLSKSKKDTAILQQCKSSDLRVFISDKKGGGTNIREKAKGKVILKLKGEVDYYMLNVTKAENGWFKVSRIWGVEWEAIELSDTVGWIHYSVIGASIRKEVNVLSVPENGKIVGKIEGETSVRIKDMCGNWVKIQHKEIEGWISSEWLCGNPVTTCP